MSAATALASASLDSDQLVAIEADVNRRFVPRGSHALACRGLWRTGAPGTLGRRPLCALWADRADVLHGAPGHARGAREWRRAAAPAHRQAVAAAGMCQPTASHVREPVARSPQVRRSFSSTS